MSLFNKIIILSLIVTCVLIIASYYRQNINSKDVSIPHRSKVNFSSVKFSESGPTFVFYNRVPKCGSSTLNNLFRSQAIRSKGKFHYKQDSHAPPVEILSREEVNSFKSWVGRKLEEKTVIFSRHIYYMDMAEFGGKVVYINQLRDPVDRFISGYHWRRWVAIYRGNHGDKNTLNHTLTQQWLHKTVEECVMDTNDRECNDFSNARVRVVESSKPWQDILPSAVPYLCGMEDWCGSATSDKAAQQAIHNIDSYYLFVGILEKMDMTIAVMKYLLPEMMKGVKVEKVEHRNHHNKKGDVDPEVRRILEERLRGEYKVYRHAVQRLEKQYKHIQTTLTNK